MSARELSHEERITWWREAKFGMFIHWGLYAVPAGAWNGTSYPGIGEWIMFKARIPVSEYEALARDFNPTAFDADAWTDLAVAAGMKYMIITAKHHDGFAMYHSKSDSFNIVDATPFDRDPIAELAAACEKRGLKFGVYYSQAQDWHAPGGAIWKTRHEGGPDFKGEVWDDLQRGSFDSYLRQKAVPQVRELLTEYGPIAIIWFDTPLDVMSVKRAALLEETVRELQPATLISGRLGGANQSDYESEGDNRIPQAVRPGDWETPATLNDTWGFRSDDENWKEPADLIFKLVDIVSKGGNYLLNVGPDARGVIPAASAEILRAVGRWVSKNGEAIYGAGSTPFGEELQNRPASTSAAPTLRFTTKANALYVSVFGFHGDNLVVDVGDWKIDRAVLIEDSAPLELSQDGSTITVRMPVQPKPPMSEPWIPVIRLSRANQ